MTYRVGSYCWGYVTPLSFLRKMTHEMATRRLARYARYELRKGSDAEREALADYLYQIFLRKPSSEFAITY